MANITPQYPSGWNTYIPNTSATNNLTIDFARNPNDFKLNNYIQTIRVDRNVGLFMRMTNEVCARFLSGNDSVWADGNEKPLGFHNLESFANETYRTIRRCFPVTLGYMATEQASWNLPAQYERILATQAMTARSQLVINALTDTSQYAASHVFDVRGDYGGGWDVSITAENNIKKTIYDAVNIILKDTLGVVQQKDLVLVIGPEDAAKLMESQEITDYIKGSPDSWNMTQGKLGSAPYGLPDTLYGIKVVVEDGVKVTNKKGSPTTRDWLFPAGTGIICARPGGLVGFEGPNFSTCVLFAKEEMTSERYDDSQNRRTIISVTEDYAAQVIAPVSGVVLTNLTSA